MLQNVRTCRFCNTPRFPPTNNSRVDLESDHCVGGGAGHFMGCINKEIMCLYCFRQKMSTMYINYPLLWEMGLTPDIETFGLKLMPLSLIVWFAFQLTEQYLPALNTAYHTKNQWCYCSCCDSPCSEWDIPCGKQQFHTAQLKGSLKRRRTAGLSDACFVMLNLGWHHNIWPSGALLLV